MSEVNEYIWECKEYEHIVIMSVGKAACLIAYLLFLLLLNAWFSLNFIKVYHSTASSFWDGKGWASIFFALFGIFVSANTTCKSPFIIIFFWFYFFSFFYLTHLSIPIIFSHSLNLPFCTFFCHIFLIHFFFIKVLVSWQSSSYFWGEGEIMQSIRNEW